LTGEGRAIAHGAATIVNAMATGKGAAFGVDLHTQAYVKLTDEPEIIVAKIVSDPLESTLLAEKTVKQVLRHFKVEERFGAKVETKSNIPIAKGLKSSSVAANAVTLATLSALGESLSDLEVVKLGVQAAFDAKVTITGAFDDACASYFGGVAVTDNLKQEIVKCSPFSEDLTVLFHLPHQKAYSADANLEKLKAVRSLVQFAYEEARAGNIWMALTLNGLFYSTAWGYNTSIALDALQAGATAAGLCGKGPAVTAVAAKDKVDSVKAALERHEGEILQAKLNQEKAKVI